jgi:hypothetical protein
VGELERRLNKGLKTPWALEIALRELVLWGSSGKHPKVPQDFGKYSVYESDTGANAAQQARETIATYRSGVGKHDELDLWSGLSEALFLLETDKASHHLTGTLSQILAGTQPGADDSRDAALALTAFVQSLLGRDLGRMSQPAPLPIDGKEMRDMRETIDIAQGAFPDSTRDPHAARRKGGEYVAAHRKLHLTATLRQLRQGAVSSHSLVEMFVATARCVLDLDELSRMSPQERMSAGEILRELHSLGGTVVDFKTKAGPLSARVRNLLIQLLPHLIEELSPAEPFELPRSA